MPNYDYVCPECKFSINIFHKMNEKASACCLSCNSGKEMVKTISGGLGFHLSGSGFYKNDYKEKSR